MDLGAGYDAHPVRMAEAGTVVTMVDLEETAASAFARAIVEKSLRLAALRFIHKDFCRLADHEIPGDLDVLYSQRDSLRVVPNR